MKILNDLLFKKQFTIYLLCSLLFPFCVFCGIYYQLVPLWYIFSAFRCHILLIFLNISNICITYNHTFFSAVIVINGSPRH